MTHGAAVHTSLLLVLAIGFALYFLPTIIAQARGHRNWIALAALNLLAGWTVLGWIGALIWSLVRAPEPVTYDDRPEYRRRYRR